MLTGNEKKAFRITVGITVLAFLLLAGGSGAVPVVEWNKTFVGTEIALVQQTTDGGYILAGHAAGYALSSGGTGYDALLIKTDANGIEQWNKTFKGQILNCFGGCGNAAAGSVQQTSDGGYIFAGNVDFNRWLVKTDSYGNEQWNKTFISAVNLGTDALVQETSDGGYIIISSSSPNYSVWLIKTDKKGDMQWNKTFWGEYINTDNYVQLTSDGGYILAGSNSPGGTWLIKTNASGNEKWSRTFGNLGILSVQQTSDGGYILPGYSNDGAWLIKTDINGNKQWYKTYGGDLGRASSVRQTLDGGYIFVGHYGSVSVVNGIIDHKGVWLTKTDANGKEQWNMTLFGEANESSASSVQQTSDGGYIIAGRISYSGYNGPILVKLSGEQGEVTKVPTASPTVKAEITKVPTVSTTEKAEETKSPIAVPTKKVEGFEVVLVIAALSSVYMFMIKRR
jgi:hypothetical protein